MTAGNLQEIELIQVELGEHPFRVPDQGETQRLKESLAQVGLLSPPRVKPGPDGRFQVITGWRRLKAAQQLGWARLPAVLLAADLPEARQLLLYLHDNAFSRPFNPWEQALLAQKLSAHWPKETVVRNFLPLMGLPPALGHWRRLLAVADLEDPWPELVARGRVSVSAAARLANWAPSDREAARPYLVGLPLTQSQQEEFLESVEILARREGVSRAEVLVREELRQALEAQGLPPRERLGTVRQLLKGWCSPRLVQAEEAFAAGLAQLGLKHHPRLRLLPPPAFEGRDFQVEIKFQDRDELRQHLAVLDRLVTDPGFSRLLSV